MVAGRGAAGPGQAGWYLLSRGAPGWREPPVGIVAILLVRRQLRLFITRCWRWSRSPFSSGMRFPKKKRESAANFDTSSDNIHLRLATIDSAWKVFRENPIQGVGVGLRKEVDATNVILIVLGETGLPGLCAFLFDRSSGGAHDLDDAALYSAHRSALFDPRNLRSACFL